MPVCRIAEMCNKEVINIKSGSCLGCVNDVEIDTCNARLVSLIIYGKLKCFGLLGRYDDIVIKWKDIEVIGNDTILVSCGHCNCGKRRRNIFSRFFK